MATLPGKAATVYVVSNPGHAYAPCFLDTALTLAWGLREIGWDACVTTKEPRPGTLNIYLGWHWLSSLPLAGSIIYNLEYLPQRWPPGDVTLPDRLAGLAQTHRIWDFSTANTDFLRDRYGIDALLMPVCYGPLLERIPPTAEEDRDIDVLFIGGISPRRQAVLDAMRRGGLNVQTGWLVFGANKDALIARAKVVLNMHYWEYSALEDERVVPCLANHRAVVAEVNERTTVTEDIRRVITPGTIDSLPARAQALVADPAYRAALETTAYNVALARDIRPHLQQALGG